MRLSTAAALATGSAGPEHLHLVAATPHFDAEPLLDVAQVLFHRPGEVDEARVVGAFQRNFAARRC